MRVPPSYSSVGEAGVRTVAPTGDRKLLLPTEAGSNPTRRWLPHGSKPWATVLMPGFAGGEAMWYRAVKLRRVIR